MSELDHNESSQNLENSSNSAKNLGSRASNSKFGKKAKEQAKKLAKKAANKAKEKVLEKGMLKAFLSAFKALGEMLAALLGSTLPYIIGMFLVLGLTFYFVLTSLSGLLNLAINSLFDREDTCEVVYVIDENGDKIPTVENCTSDKELEDAVDNSILEVANALSDVYKRTVRNVNDNIYSVLSNEGYTVDSAEELMDSTIIKGEDLASIISSSLAGKNDNSSLTYEYAGYGETSKIEVVIDPSFSSISASSYIYYQAQYLTMKSFNDNIKEMTDLNNIVAITIPIGDETVTEQTDKGVEYVSISQDDCKKLDAEVRGGSCVYHFINKEKSNSMSTLQMENLISVLKESANEIISADLTGGNWTIDIHEDVVKTIPAETISCTVNDSGSGWTTDSDSRCSGVLGEANSTQEQTVKEAEEVRGPVGTITIPLTLNQNIEYYEASDITVASSRDMMIENIAIAYDVSQAEAEYLFNDLLSDYIQIILDSGNFTGEMLENIQSSLGSYTGYDGVIGDVAYDGNFPWTTYSYGDINGALYDSKKLFQNYSQVWSHVAAAIRETGYTISGFVNSGLSPQCTDFVFAMFYDYYGLPDGQGNGIDVARNTVAKYPDKFYDGKDENGKAVLKGGSIISSNVGTTSAGHVGFINAVLDNDGDGQWDHIIVSDGNVCKGGVRVWATYTKQEFYNAWGYNFTLCVPR